MDGEGRQVGEKKLTTDCTDYTDKKQMVLSYPCNHCNPWFFVYLDCTISAANWALWRTSRSVSERAAFFKAGKALREPIRPSARAAASRTCGLPSPARVAANGS